MIDDKILREFGSIEALHLFLREKINDGEQISKGKDGSDDTKEKKKAEAPEKPDPAGDAESDSGEDPENLPPGAGAPEGGAEMAAGDEPLVDPVATPGSQVQMGGIPHDEKDDKVIDNPDAVEIKISGKKEKINKRPSVEVSKFK